MNNDMIQSISIDPSALLTTSTINALHFPDLATSGISDSGGGKMTSLNLDGVGMCESMTESYCSVGGQDEALLINTTNGLQNDTSMNHSLKNIGKKESLNTQKKRRSRKAQYDAAHDSSALDKIEPVNIDDEHIEPDDAWLFHIPGSTNKASENIFSWVHKEFKENDIHATKHRLLCKLDDMSNARTIRSISCHSFNPNQSIDSVKRSSTEQQVHPEPLSTMTRMTSPLRTATPLFNGNGNTRPTSPASSSPLRQTVSITNSNTNYPNNTVRSREVSKEREREPLDYTDLEVMAKVQLENLRQAERQGPLSKRFGGSSNTLLSTDSRDNSPSSVFGATRNTSPVGNHGYVTPRRSYSPSPAAAGRIPVRKNSFVVTESQYTHVLPSVSPRSSSPAIRTDPSGTKPPLAPKSLVPRNGTKPNNHRRSNTQTISTTIPNGYELPDATDPKPSPPPPLNRANNVATPTTTNRTRPPTSRPIPAYRGSQTTYINPNTTKVQQQPAPSTTQKLTKKPSNDLGSTFTARQFATNDNNLLNDVSNKPLTTPSRSQMVSQRRIATQSSVDKIPPSSSIDMTTTTLTNGQTSIPRSASSLSQVRKSGIPTIGKQQRPSIPTSTRTTATTNTIPSSQSSDSMMATRNIRTQSSITRPQISDITSPTSSWNEGCY